jgi:carbon monoxide dehydrogenase subunit G
MELTHSFTVPVPLDQAWDVLLDVEKVAPCMPGATLDSVTGDEITGKIKVKVGPISMTYAGKAKFTERDREAAVVKLEASGKETRGAGTASATVRSELSGQGDETHVTVLTNLNVTGKPAQFGRGVLSEVGGRLIGIFADNLAKMLAAEPPAGGGAGVPGGAGVSGDGASPAEAVTMPATAAPAVAAAAEHTAPIEQPGLAEQAAAAEQEVAAEQGGQPDQSASDDLALPIEELNLPLRVYNSLRREGVHTVSDLVAQTPQQLLAIDHIGRASVEDIRQRLASRGLSLSEAPAGSPSAAAPSATTAAANGAVPVAPPAAVPAEARPESPAAPADAPAAPVAAAAEAPRLTPPTPLRSVPTVPADQAKPSWYADDDAIDLLSVAGFPVLKRAIPVAAGVVVVAVVVVSVRRVRRRSRD